MRPSVISIKNTHKKYFDDGERDCSDVVFQQPIRHFLKAYFTLVSGSANH
jgi:hypothetical protein